MTGGERDPELSVSALEYERGGLCAVVSLAGRAGITDCAWVGLLLELQAAHARGRLVVDLSRLSSMDWWVALILIWAGRVVSRRGGVLVLAGPQPAVARVLDAAGTPKVVAVYDSVQQAGRSAALVSERQQVVDLTGGSLGLGRHAIVRHFPGVTRRARGPMGSIA